MNRALYSFVQILDSLLRLRIVPVIQWYSVVKQMLKILGPRYARHS